MVKFDDKGSFIKDKEAKNGTISKNQAYYEDLDSDPFSPIQYNGKKTLS